MHPRISSGTAYSIALLSALLLSSCGESNQPASPGLSEVRSNLATPPGPTAPFGLRALYPPPGNPVGNNAPLNFISLTYDDGPDDHTLDLASYLASQNIPATFFVATCRFAGQPIAGLSPDGGPPLGSLCQDEGTQYPLSYLQSLVNYGHRVANHTADHNADPPNTALELGHAQSVIDPYIQDGLSYFRTPGNGWTTDMYNAVRADPSLDGLVGEVAYDTESADWQCFCDTQCPDGTWECQANPTYCKSLNPPAGDANGNSLTVAQCAANHINAMIASLAAGRPLGIVDLHDNLYQSHHSMRALELATEIVRQMRASGNSTVRSARFVPIDAFPGFEGTNSFSAPYDTFDFGDDGGWQTHMSHYGTLQFADVNGDGKLDICARGASGPICIMGDGTGHFGPYEWWLESNFSNATGWLPDEYGSTLQFADINGDGCADVCGRGVAGVWCALSRACDNPPAHGFRDFRLWNSDFSDAGGWNTQESYYGSIRLADMNGDGKADLCGRGSGGVFCYLSDGNSFSQKSAVNDFFSSPNGWLPAQYGTTIQFADLNHDGRADVCGRRWDGVYCGLSYWNGTNWAFSAPTRWTTGNQFGDVDGWNSMESRYRSIRLGDVDGDGYSDICGRDQTGIVCAFSNGMRFTRYHYMKTVEFTDALTWNGSPYGSTLLLGDISGDHKSDICLRASRGVVCALAP